MASAVGMMVAGALVNALAFSGSNYLFSKMGRKDTQEERKRHDLAIEQLQSAQAEWSKKRQARLDYINQQLRAMGHATKTFTDVETAMQEYNLLTGKSLGVLGDEPKISDFYTPSDDQRNREILFITAGMGLAAFTTYKLTR